jgi:hypothetical protein
MTKELINEVFKHSGIRRAAKDSTHQNTILGIRRQNLIALVTVELRLAEVLHRVVTNLFVGTQCAYRIQIH